MPIRGIEPPLAHAHPQGVYYVINLQTQVCTKGKLQGPFIPHAVCLAAVASRAVQSRRSPQLDI